MKYAWRMAAVLLILFGGCAVTEEPSEAPAPERRILYNSDTGNAFAEFWGRGAPLSEMDAEAVREVVARGIDELARAGVDTLSMVVSHRFHSLYGPSQVLEEHWRQADKGDGYQSLREAGVDFRQLMADLSHRSGMEFIGCIRMNDRHGGPVGRFIEENPQWHLKLRRGPAIDFAPEPVRQKMLDYIEELLATVDLDGLELDYMRWCHMFPPGQGNGNAHLLTDFMRKTRILLDAAAERKARDPLILGVRVPQTLKECEYPRLRRGRLDQAGAGRFRGAFRFLLHRPQHPGGGFRQAGRRDRLPHLSRHPPDHLSRRRRGNQRPVPLSSRRPKLLRLRSLRGGDLQLSVSLGAPHRPQRPLAGLHVAGRPGLPEPLEGSGGNWQARPALQVLCVVGRRRPDGYRPQG